MKLVKIWFDINKFFLKSKTKLLVFVITSLTKMSQYIEIEFMKQHFCELYLIRNYAGKHTH